MLYERKNGFLTQSVYLFINLIRISVIMTDLLKLVEEKLVPDDASGLPLTFVTEIKYASAHQ